MPDTTKTCANCKAVFEISAREDDGLCMKCQADLIATARPIERKYGYVRRESYRNRPIDYIDLIPKPFIAQIPLVEYFERIKRHKADKWQIDFCSRLQGACEIRHEQTARAIIHAEAQLGKSSILAQCFAAWILGHDPLHRIALATYNVTRSQAHSKAVIGIMNLPIHKEIFPNKDGWVNPNASKEKWKTNARNTQTTDAQDSFNPVGLQSGLTGSGFDTLVLDDPYADQKEAFSETVRQNLIDFWEFTVMSRIGIHSNVFGMFHRYHVEDLAGYLLSTGDFDYWRYATICDGDYIHEDTGKRFSDPLDREIGEYISERRQSFYYTKNRLNKRVWNSMFQGKPTSDEGDFFHVGKIKELTESETEQRRQECSVMVRAWDLAATEEGGDYSVAPLIGMSADKRSTICDVVREQVESAGRDALMLATAKRDGFGVVVSIPQDPGAAGKTAVFHIEQLLAGYTVVVRPTSGSKEDRARPLASAVNVGEISVAPGEWVKPLMREFRNFPLSDHDDFVDSAADGYNECFERVSKGLVVKNPLTLQLWQEFRVRFGVKIPKHWTVYAAVRITDGENIANSAVIVARAAQNSGLDDTLFVVAEYKKYTSNFSLLFEWLDKTLKVKCAGDTAIIWLHPESGQYQAVLQQKLKRTVILFQGDAIDGLTELNWYVGSGKLIGLIEDAEQMRLPLDEFGLVGMRQESTTWGYNEKNEPTKIAAVLECLRMLAHRFRTFATELTDNERVEEAMPPAYKIANMLNNGRKHLTDSQQLARSLMEREVRDKLKIERELPDWMDEGGRELERWERDGY